MWTMQMEQWKDVSGFEGKYSVSNFGRVRSTYHSVPIILKQGNSRGYKRVRLYKDNKYVHCTVHSLVAKMFIGDRPDGCQINHKDWVKTNNHIDNLEYVTPSQNIKHSFLNVKRKVLRGNKCPWKKLSSDNVLAIRTAYSNGTTTYRKLAREYGIDFSTIGYIIRKELWKVLN